MKVLITGLTLLISTLSVAGTVGDIESKLNQEVCGDNLPSMAEAFNLPEIYGMHSFVHMTKFQQATQSVLASVSDVHNIEVDALLVEKNQQKADLAKDARLELNSYASSMLREVKAEDRYNGLTDLCSYLNR